MPQPAPPAGHVFHHVGIACGAIEREQVIYAALGYRIEGSRFEDAAQGVAGCFMTGAGPRIELLENLSGSSTLTPWLASGSRMYHFAYEVDDMGAALAWARGQRAKVMVQPVPAVAFGGRRIAFVMFRSMAMIEFIARSRGDSGGASAGE